MEEQISLTALVSGYTANVRSLEREISTLQADAKELTKAVEADKAESEAAQANLDALKRTRASLESERESLRAEFGEAQLDNDVQEQQRIRTRKREIDSELEQVAESVRENVVLSNDYGERAATLQVERDELGKRLPKQFYNTSANLHPMLEAVSEVLRDDADRLRKMHAAIKMPAASKDAVEEARRQRGVKATADPAWLVEQERKRQERLKRFDGVQGSTDAMHAAMTRTYREPEPSVKATTDADGRLSGDAIRAALAAKQSA